MKSFVWGAMTCFLVLGGSSVLAQPAPEYVEGEAIVTVRGAADMAGVKEALGQKEIQITRSYGAISQLRGKHYIAVKAPGRTTSALIAELKKNPEVEAAEPNYISHLNSNLSPNDTYFSVMWGMHNTGQFVYDHSGTAGDDISFNAAWGLASTNTNEVVVAVIDSGIDTGHPDLVANLWTNPGEIPGNATDDDGNGYVDDVHGWNAAGGNSTITDSGYHGTHVSGTIAATGNNNRGVIGVDFQAKLMMLRASNDGESLLDSWIISALDYIVTMKMRGVNIVAINASYGGYGYDSAEEAAVQSAGDVGIVFCAAAGNDIIDNDVFPAYPASFPLSNIISVAASDQDDDLTWFSNYGATSVDLAAPGENIFSTVPTWYFTGSDSNFAYTDIYIGSSIYHGTNLVYSGNSSVYAVIFDCGVGQSYQFLPFVNGNIALMERGTISLAQKVANAMAAGATAAIIYNNTSGGFEGSLDSPGNWINAVAISREDGLAIKAMLPAVGSLVTTVESFTSDVAYGYLDGTSMATPHVAGAVAFAAMNFPEDDYTQRIQRVLTNVDIVPALSGLMTTGGRLNLQRIVDVDDNGLPDWWEYQYFGHYTGTSTNADSDGDGASEWSEWVARTDPTSALSRLWVTDITYNETPVGLTVHWSSVDTRSYFVQRTYEVDSSTPTFLTVATNVAGVAGTTTYLDTSVSTNTEVYYRVAVPQ